jgi:hypothetical protein
VFKILEDSNLQATQRVSVMPFPYIKSWPKPRYIFLQRNLRLRCIISSCDAVRVLNGFLYCDIITFKSRFHPFFKLMYSLFNGPVGSLFGQLYPI